MHTPPQRMHSHLGGQVLLWLLLLAAGGSRGDRGDVNHIPAGFRSTFFFFFFLRT